MSIQADGGTGKTICWEKYATKYSSTHPFQGKKEPVETWVRFRERISVKRELQEILRSEETPNAGEAEASARDGVGEVRARRGVAQE